MILEFTCYRLYLKSVLAERIAGNDGYSLRAFAANLGIAPSSLSEVLKGRKNFSIKTALRVSRPLGLTDGEKDYFLSLVEYSSSSSADLREKALRSLNRIRNSRHQSEVNDLPIDQFRMISDWYHNPIAAMPDMTEIELTPEYASGMLGISTFEASAAIERLLRLGVLTRDSKGKINKSIKHWIASAEVPNEALRNYHRQMLAKTEKSIDEQLPHEKLIGTETFAFDPQLLKKAERLTENYFKKMQALGSQGQRNTTVYHLGIQFFKLADKNSPNSKPTPKKEKK